MKPELPTCIASRFPDSVLKHIYSYVPHLRTAVTSPSYICTVSPNMARDLRLIQMRALSGKSAAYLRELEDFLLDDTD